MEFQAPTEVYASALSELRSRDVTDAEVLARAEQMLGSDVVARH